MTKVLDTLASSGFVLALNGRGGTQPKVTIPREGKETLAVKYGLDASLVKAGISALPAPHDEEWKAMKKAHGLVRSEFYQDTMPLGHKPDASEGTAKRTASGDRFLVASKITSGSFGQKFTISNSPTDGALYSALDLARQQAASTISVRVAEVYNSGKLGDLFPMAVYPDYADIQAGWFYEPITLRPMARSDVLEGMFLPADVARNIEANMEAQAAEQLKFGQQTLILETVEYLQNMTEQLTKLSDWYRTQQGRRPSIFDSLTGNVKSSLQKLRDYAMPETESGAQIMDLVDAVQEQLDQALANTSGLKNDPTAASQAARDADTAAKKLQESLGLIWDDNPPVSQTPPTNVSQSASSAQTANMDLDDVSALFAGGSEPEKWTIRLVERGESNKTRHSV